MYALLLSPGAAMAGGSEGVVDYSPQLGDGRTIIVEPGNAYIDGNGYKYKNLTIECEEGVQLTIKDLKIDNSFYYSSCGISFAGRGNRLNLEGSSEIIGGWLGAAITVEGEAELTISGEGSLTAQGGSGSAGIGGNRNENVPRETAADNNTDCGKIVIESGEINAAGGYDAAGIGGGFGGDGGVIEIKGGCVHAESGGNAAAIGGGSGCYEWYTDYEDDSEYSEAEHEPNGKGNAGVIKITGGKVYTSGDYETAVGCGLLGRTGRVELSGKANIHLNKTRLGKYEDGYGTANKDVEFIFKDATVYKYGADGLFDLNKSDYIENDLYHVTIKLGSNGNFTMAYGDMHYFDHLYIVDGEGNKREVLCINGRNVIEVFMPEGRYHIEHYGDTDEQKLLFKSEGFEVKGDSVVSPDLYPVSADFDVYCDEININAMLEDGERRDSNDYTVRQGRAVDLEIRHDYETQVSVNGKKLGLIYGPFEVRPGQDSIIIEAVSGDGSVKNVFTVNTTSEADTEYPAWYWPVLGGGALLLVLFIILFRKRLFAKKAAGIAVCVMVSAAVILSLGMSLYTPGRETGLQDPDLSQQNTHTSMSSTYAVTDDYIFYTMRNGSTSLRDLYRYDTEMGETALIAKNASFNIAVSEGKVFFERKEENGGAGDAAYWLYCVNIDGSGEQRIVQGGHNVSTIFVSKNKLYYESIIDINTRSCILYAYDISEKTIERITMDNIIDEVRGTGSGTCIYIDTYFEAQSYLLDERTNTLMKQDEAVYMELNGYKVVNKSEGRYVIINEAGDTAAEFTSNWPGNLARYYQYIIYWSDRALWAFNTDTGELKRLGNVNVDFIELYEAKDKLYASFALGWSKMDAGEFYDVLLFEEISIEHGGLVVREVIRHETWDAEPPKDTGFDPEYYYLHG